MGRAFNLLPLSRGGAIPLPAAAEPIDAELEGLHAQAAAAEFGQEVATDLVLSPASGVARGSVGLVRSGEPPCWLFCEHVPNAELGAWEADKQAEAGRDRRLRAR